MTVQEPGIDALIAALRNRGGDTASVEVKSGRGGCPQVGETLCAFANMPEGGLLLVGLDEVAGFQPVGLQNLAALEQGIASQARVLVSPPVHCEFEDIEVEGQAVLAVRVHPLLLRDRPAQVRGHAYLRQADGDYRMSEQELAYLELQKTQAIRPTHPDRTALEGYSRTDLDPQLVDAFLAAARRESRRYAVATDTEVLEYTGVLARNGAVTLAGLYALGKAPQAVAPNLAVTAAVQLPADEGRSRDLRHLVGPIPDMLDDTMSWVARNTRTTMAYDERGHGVDHPELPLQVVREIVANALVHRNLDPITDSKRVEVRLDADRLVVSSPGGLWGVSESQLGRPGAKSAVNPTLYEICKLARLPDGSRVIEGEGGGLREAIEAMRVAGLRAPDFVDSGVSFTVIVHRHPLPAGARPARPGTPAGDGRSPQTTRHGRRILDGLEAPQTFQQIAARSGLTTGQTRYAIGKLLDAGLLVQHGGQGVRGTTYTRA